MTKKYRTELHNEGIREVEIENETAHYVLVKGEKRRDAKRSDWYNYFDTWEEAKEFLVGRAQQQVTSLKGQLALAEAALETVLRLRKEDAIQR